MKNLPVLVLLATAVLFVAGVWYSLERRIARGEVYAPYSTYRSDVSGTRRLFLFYRDAGLEPVRLKSELLMFEEEGLLFIIEPRNQALPSMGGGMLSLGGTFLEQEMDALLGWISEGNSLVLVSTHDTNLHERLGVSIVQENNTGGSLEAKRTQVSPLTKSLSKIQLRRPGQLEFINPGWVELFAISPSDGSAPLVQAAVRKIGNGTVVVLADPYVLTNMGVLNSGNLALSVRLAGLVKKGKIYFDEFHHGVSDPRTILSYLRLRNLHFVLFQVLAIFAFFIWRGRMRLGRPRSIKRETERGSAEYVRAFSLIYRRANLHNSVIKSAYELFREKAAVWVGLARGTGAAEIADIMKLRNEEAAKRFKAITARVGAGYKAGNADVLIIMKAIAQFEKEYINARRRARKTS